MKDEEKATGKDSAALARYRNDPVRYAREVLGVRLWDKQVEVARALVQHKRVFVKASHSVGKSFLAGGLVNWFLTALIRACASPLRRQRGRCRIFCGRRYAPSAPHHSGAFCCRAPAGWRQARNISPSGIRRGMTAAFRAAMRSMC